MTPAPGAGGEEVKKKRKRRRSRSTSKRTQQSPQPAAKKHRRRPPYARRVDETSAGGLVIDKTGTKGLLIGRLDIKDQTREKLLWSLPKGHIEEGETPEQAALREVNEETGIQCSIDKSLGVIDFWFMAGGKRIHKTVHHFVFRETGGKIAPQISEVDDVRWFPLEEIVDRLAYPDERKLIARSQELLR
jgi:8-oxo-dGTP pyrophosphatase MutT (NUDIX family)